MKTFAIACAALVLAGPVLAASGGKIDTLQRGTYACELPGDAATQRGVPVPEANFEITNSSTYKVERGGGTYLRTGETVAMTSGPLKGERYRVQSERMLKQLAADGSESGMRCVKLGTLRS